MMATSTWFEKSNSTLKTNFCPVCSSLLNLPGQTGQVSCGVCGYSCNTDDLETKVIVTRRRKADNVKKSQKFETEYAAKINDGSVECPKCEHKELYFKTAQLRSADEGQTVFYECTKCAFTWSVNT